MKRIDTTYQEFCQLVANNPGQKFYVKNHNGELVPVRACGKKVADTWVVEFDNEYIIEAADKHAFMDVNNQPLYVKDLKPGDQIKTVDGTIKVRSRHSFKKQQDVYDISIDAPHWYTNDDVGIIHHNTLFSLIMAKAYMDKYDDAIMLFYDSEMGASKSYFESLDIDLDRVLHTPITDVEQLKFDIMSQLEEIKRGDHVIIVVDSVGNLASKKEIEDALSEKSSADMTRAKALKSIVRMIIPHLNLKSIPMIVINHIYMDMGLFPKAITSGGCLVENTKIQMADGSLKNIQDVVPGEQVKTNQGFGVVEYIWNPETLEDGNPECYQIEFEDGSSVVCSAGHKFLVDGQWVEAKDLTGLEQLTTV